MGDVDQGKAALTDACRAAKRRHSGTLDRKLKELGKLNLNEPNLRDSAPDWVQQIIKDEGLRLRENVILKKGPGYGLAVDIKW